MRSALLLLALTVALVLVPAPALARQRQPQAAAPIEISADGFELLRALLDRAGIKPVTRQDADRGRIGNGQDVIVIAVGTLPQRGIGNDPINHVHNTISNGGAALVASDSAVFLGNAWKEDGTRQASASIFGANVECKDSKASHPAGQFWSECPYAVPVGRREFPRTVDPDIALARIFRGDQDTNLRPLNRVATNAPSYLAASDFAGQWRFPLAGFPQNTVVVGTDQFGNPREQRLPANALFAAGGYGPDNNIGSRYHFLVMADHSVFINQMLIEPGTDNLELAYRAIEYLQGPQKRKRCLFLENGRVIESFDELRQALAKGKPSPLPGMPSQEKIVDIANDFADKLQENNVPNSLIMGPESRPDIQNERLAYILKRLLVIAAIYAIWYLMKRMFTLRKPTDLPPAPAVAGAATGPPGVFERRQRELLRRDNVYEPVRDLVREFLGSVGILGTEHGPKLPKLFISDEVRKPESLRAALRDFWKLAYGPPQEVTIARWRELEPYFERLRDAHAAGKWRFVLAGVATV